MQTAVELKKTLRDKQFFLDKEKREFFKLTEEEIQAQSDTGVLKALIQYSSHLGRLGKKTVLEICSSSQAAAVLKLFPEGHKTLRLFYTSSSAYIELFQKQIARENALILVNTLGSNENLSKIEALRESENESDFNFVSDFIKEILEYEIEDLDELLSKFIRHSAFFVKKFDLNKDKLIELFKRKGILPTIKLVTANKTVMDKIDAEDLCNIMIKVDKNYGLRTLKALSKDDLFDELESKFGYKALIKIARQYDSAEVLLQMYENRNKLVEIFPDPEDRAALRPKKGVIIVKFIEHYQRIIAPDGLDLDKDKQIELINAGSANLTLETLLKEKENENRKIKNYKICSPSEAEELLKRVPEDRKILQLFYTEGEDIKLYQRPVARENALILVNTLRLNKNLSKIQTLNQSENKSDFNFVSEVIKEILEHEIEALDELLLEFIRHSAFFVKKFGQSKDKLIELFKRKGILPTIKLVTANKTVMDKIDADDLYCIMKKVDKNHGLRTLNALSTKGLFDELESKFSRRTLIRIAKQYDSAEVLIQMYENREKLVEIFPDPDDRAALRPKSGAIIIGFIAHYKQIIDPDGLDLDKEEQIKLINAGSANSTLETLLKANAGTKIKNYQTLRTKGYSSEDFSGLIKSGFGAVQFLVDNDLTELKDKEGHSFTPTQLAAIPKLGKLKTLQKVRETFYVLVEMGLSIEDMFFLISKYTGSVTIDVFVTKYETLKKLGFKLKESLCFVKTKPPLAAVETLLMHHVTLFARGFTPTLLARLVSGGNGKNRIINLLNESPALLAQNLSPAAIVSLIQHSGEKGLKANTFMQNKKQVLNLGFDETQFNDICKYSGYAEALKVIINKFGTLHHKMHFSVKQIAKIAAQGKAAPTLDALIEYHTNKKNKPKVTNDELVMLTSHAFAIQSLNAFFDHYQALIKKGIEHSDIVSIASQRHGGKALKWFAKKLDALLTYRDKNGTLISEEQIISIAKHPSSAKTLRYFVKHHAKLTQLIDGRGMYLEHKHLVDIASHAFASENLKALIERHPTLTQLEDKQGNKLDNSQIYRIMNHDSASTTIMFLIEKFECGNNTLKATHSCNYTLFTDLEENGGFGLSNAELVDLCDHFNAFRELKALKAHFRILRNKGYSKVQLLSLAGFDAAYKTLDFLVEHHDALVRIEDKHGRKLTVNEIFVLSNYYRSNIELKYLLDNHEQLTRSKNCTIDDLLLIGRHVRGFDTAYDGLKAKNFKHETIVEIASYKFASPTFVLATYDKFTRPKSAVGFGFTHDEFIRLASRDFAKNYMNGITIYLNGSKSKRITPAEIMKSLDNTTHLKTQSVSQTSASASTDQMDIVEQDEALYKDFYSCILDINAQIEETLSKVHTDIAETESKDEEEEEEYEDEDTDSDSDEESISEHDSEDETDQPSVKRRKMSHDPHNRHRLFSSSSRASASANLVDSDESDVEEESSTRKNRRRELV